MLLPSIEIKNLDVVGDEDEDPVVDPRCDRQIFMLTGWQDGFVGTDLRPADCLIVVDVQRAFVDGPKAIPGGVRLVERVSRLLTAARQAGTLVVHLQNDGLRGALDEPGTPGWELPLAPSEPGRNEVIIRKFSDDGFVGTSLAEMLKRRRVHRVVIVGLLSEMCVSATARAALARGLSVVVPRDAHGTYDLNDIPADVVARVAEHALGDEPDLVDSAEVTFVGSR